MRNAFWVVSLGVIAAYLFFFALGAYAVDEVAPLSIAVGVLIVLWAVHAWMQSRHPPDTRDPRIVQGRERRGF
jgi:Co/Zn/Cd efflux system component